MAEADVRVALLARAGAARDQLRRALGELGASLVAEGDPAELDPAEVIGKSPTLVVVSLEPAIEPALDRFDELMSLPNVEIMYDDAEVTRQLDGWDLNRWARHLAAKLLGRDVLPPAPGGSDAMPELDMTPVPGAPPTPAQLMDEARFEDYAQDAPELAEWVPSSPSLTDVPAPAAPTPAAEPEPAFEAAEAEAMFTLDEPAPVVAAAPEPAAADDGLEFNMDPAELEKSLQQLDDGMSAPAMSESELTLDSGFDLDVDLSHLEAGPSTDPAPEPVSRLNLEDTSSTIADFEPPVEPVRFSQFDQDAIPEEIGDLDADVAALAAQLEAFEKADKREAAREPDFTMSFNEAPKPAAARPRQEVPAAASAAAAPVDLSNLSLLAEDAVHAPVGASAAPKSAGDISSSFDTSSLSLVPEDEWHHAVSAGKGIVLILAGIGGPDAVRQLLSSLPESLPVPVLLYQHLEVGKHDRLVDQLAKISKLPVLLAKSGEVPPAGQVSVLGAGMTVHNEGAYMRFHEGALGDIIDIMPPASSAILMLSGADANLVPAALRQRDSGALVLAQDPDNCFDPAAAQALKKQGAPSYPATGLARQIAQRWPE
ncbi:chemotaxis protein CheB [Arenimonas sp.]|uniref:chemotaxis protein CheB n=1 Tax=Arenimonas sp. TaxID=1872635 RepID=UPI0039E5CE1E